MTDERDPGAPLSRPDSVGLPSIMRSDDTVLSPGQPARGQLPALGLPGYEFIREIHRGGQGVVYLALQRATHRHVAIKVMREGPFAGPDDRARFDREVRILAHLKHPSIVAIHDSGAAAGCDYFVMDYIEGQPLDEYLKSHPLPIPDLVELFRRICEAVQSAHHHGVVHRDLKPGNIRIDRDGVPYILDFGLAKIPGSAFEASQMTQTGLFIGSLPWASPEQAEGHVSRTDPRTDVYSLGVIFYTALTGHPPYSVSGSVSDAIHQILNAAPARPTIFRREIESDLETIVLKCLQKEPHRRYANAGELAADLAAYQSGQPISAKRDSTIYVVKKRTRRWVNANPLPTYALIALVAFLTADLLIRPLVHKGWKLGDRNVGADMEFRRIATRWASPTTPSDNLSHVRVVTLTDKSNVNALIAREKLADVRPDKPPSFRRLHGRLMERLARARPRAVVFDLSFSAPSPFDEDFVRGVNALRTVGADVVAGVKTWELDDDGQPKMSPAILKTVRWGSMQADLTDGAPWALHILLLHPGSDTRPALALTAVAAYRHPGTQMALSPDWTDNTVAINYWRPGEDATSPRRWLKEFDNYALTILQAARGAPKTGVSVGDMVGIFALAMPAQSVLDQATVDYVDVFSAEDPQLQEWFSDKVVVIGYSKPGEDRFAHPDGRQIAGCYAHAVGIESLLTASSIRVPLEASARWLVLVGAIVGAAVGAVIASGSSRMSSSRITLLVVLLLLSTAIFVGSLVLYRLSRNLVNPTVPLVALWIAATLSAGIRRTKMPSTFVNSSQSKLT